MDIIGMGSEIVECPRIGGMIERHGELFLRRVYTEREIRQCHARKRALEHFAGLWAAKEAVLKALGVRRGGGGAWVEVEIRSAPQGAHRVLVQGAVKEAARSRGVGDILVSIARCRTYATAHALAVGSRARSPEPDRAEWD